MSGQVKYLPWITRDMLRAEPEARFVFGDNAKRVGLGGQAAEMRGEPNAIGVATMGAPGKYLLDCHIGTIWLLMRDLDEVRMALQAGRTVYAPRDGLGTGIARLPEFAPNTANLITAFFHACPGERCPWEFV